MTRDQYQEIVVLAEKRNALYYGWLRQLITMAAGALSVLVALNAGAGSTGIAHALLGLSWGTGGIGILTGAIALYGEPHQARVLARGTVASINAADAARAAGRDPQPAPVHAPEAWWMRASATLCTTSLTIALAALVGFAVLR